MKKTITLPAIDGQSPDNQQPIRKPRLGSRAAAIRRDKMRYPELGPSALARRAGCTPSNASQVLATFLHQHTTEELHDFQQNKADILDATAMRFVESVTDAKLAKTPATSAIVAVGILHDKSALLRGQATGILNVQVLMDLASLIRRDD